MNFYKYLKYELHYPLTHLSNVFEAYFMAISDMFDNIVSDSKILQKEFFCLESKNTIKYAEERAITPIYNETYESTLNRILYAYNFYTGIVTQKGIKTLIKFITDKSFSIKLDKRDERNPFTYYIYFYDVISDEEILYIKNALREYIKAHIEIVLVQQAFTPWIVGEARIGMIQIA